MALNGTAMGDAVASAIKGVIDGKGQGDCDLGLMKEIWEAACTQIVSHITANAVIPPGINVSTTGSASAQTGATTGPGQIT
jgi:hypothetical protein